MAGNSTLTLDAQEKLLQQMRERKRDLADGKPRTVLALPAVEKVERLCSEGAGPQDIATWASVSYRTISGIIREARRLKEGEPGKPLKIYRSTRERIMAIPDHLPETLVRRGPAAHLGPADAVPAFPTRRRLQALRAEGFSAVFIARSSGFVHHSHVCQLTYGGGRNTTDLISAQTEKKLIRVYREFAGRDPLLFIPSNFVSQSRNTGRRKGWAPSHCWDDDTIRDPDAIPQWTGKCGTVGGYHSHKRYHIPVCPPCAAAWAAYQKERRAS